MYDTESCENSIPCKDDDGKNVHAAEITDDERIDFVAACILKKYKKAFQELAK